MIQLLAMGWGLLTLLGCVFFLALFIYFLVEQRRIRRALATAQPGELRYAGQGRRRLF